MTTGSNDPADIAYPISHYVLAELARFDGWVTNFRSAAMGTYRLEFGLPAACKDEAFNCTDQTGIVMEVIVCRKQFITPPPHILASALHVPGWDHDEHPLTDAAETR